MNIGVRFPKDNSLYGAWMNQSSKSDVHVYVQKDFGAVIGWNKDYRDNVQFSDLALSLTEDKAVIQFADANGNCVTKELNKDLVHAALLNLLHQLKATAA